jgi:hypothetical protein
MKVESWIIHAVLALVACCGMPCPLPSKSHDDGPRDKGPERITVKRFKVLKDTRRRQISINT